MPNSSVYYGGNGTQIVSGEITAAQFTALAARVTALETLIGASASAGLRKSIADLETAVGNADSGLVKDVADLKTTVGDNTAGLVKRVSDLEASAETPAAGES